MHTQLHSATRVNPPPGNELLSKDQFVDVVKEKLDQVSVIWNSLYSDWDETLEELDISMFVCVLVCLFHVCV